MREPQSEEPALRHGRLMWTGLVAATILTILFGIAPGALLDMVIQAARAIA
jgi:hypothetical protein